MNVTTHKALLSAALALGAALGGQAAMTHAASSQTTASALVDSFNGSGELIKARSTAHGLRGLTVRWRSGVSMKIPRLTQNTQIAAYTIVIDPSKPEVTGVLSTSKSTNAKASSVVLRSRDSSSITVKLTAGATRPQIDIASLPADVKSLQLTTVGKGRNLIRISARCKDKRRRTSTVLTLRQGDNSRARTIRATSSTVCGAL